MVYFVFICCVLVVCCLCYMGNGFVGFIGIFVDLVFLESYCGLCFSEYVGVLYVYIWMSWDRRGSYEF